MTQIAPGLIEAKRIHARTTAVEEMRARVSREYAMTIARIYDEDPEHCSYGQIAYALALSKGRVVGLVKRGRELREQEGIA